MEPAAWNQPPLEPADTCRPRRHVGGTAAATVGNVATSDLCVAHAGAAAECAASTADEQCGRGLHSDGLAPDTGFAARNSRRDIGELRTISCLE